MSTSIAFSGRTALASDVYFIREEFRNGATGLVLVANSSSGGSSNTTTNPAAGENRDGIIQLRTGSTASADQRGGVASNLTHFYLGDGNQYYAGFGIRGVSPYFDGTLTGRIELGFADVISTTGGGFIGFLSTNGGNWTCVSTNSSATTTFDTGLTASSTTWRDFALVYYAGGTRIDWFVAGALVHTFWAAAGSNNATNTYSANINTTTNRAGLKATVHRVSSTGTQVALDLDYIDFAVRYSSTARARNAQPLSLIL